MKFKILMVLAALAWLTGLSPSGLANDNAGTAITYREELVWTPVGKLDKDGKGIFVSIICGDLQRKEPLNFLMKYSAGVKAPPHTHSHDYYAVVVSGTFRHFLKSEGEVKALTAGSKWIQHGGIVHQDACVGPDDCVLDIFWPKGFDVSFVESNRPAK